MIDQDGVGDLMRIAVERGRSARADLKLGICGEHGGEPKSVAFCHGLGLDYVCCSPYRVPLARLAAAQAALAEQGIGRGRHRRLRRSPSPSQYGDGDAERRRLASRLASDDDVEPAVDRAALAELREREDRERAAGEAADVAADRDARDGEREREVEDEQRDRLPPST